jgi:hypothetical protein
MREADLYPPLKAYLERQGYHVKAEIGACDILARRGDDPPLVVEMKTTFSLQLLMQGVARQGLFDTVYLAVPVSARRGWVLRYRDIIALCRRLGLGLLAVDVPQATVTAHLDPAPYKPRKSAPRAARLLREFDHRVGDPNTAGTTRTPRMTAYRQDALRCAAELNRSGPSRAMLVARTSGVARAGSLLRANHYGWFDRVTTGVYALSPRGKSAVIEHQCAISALLSA